MVKKIFIDTILIAVIGFAIFLILIRLFPSIKSGTALIITLSVVYIIYYILEFILFEKKKL